MKRKPRAKRPIEKDKPSGYDSKWEKTLHDTLLQDWVHHDGKVPYVIALPSTTEVVFLFANASSPMPQAKRRKDGTKRTHGEWASDNGFRWFTVDTLPDEWRSEE